LPDLSARPNDVTEARLRVSQCVTGAPDMDVFMNGKVPVTAGVPISLVAGIVLLSGSRLIADGKSCFMARLNRWFQELIYPNCQLGG